MTTTSDHDKAQAIAASCAEMMTRGLNELGENPEAFRGALTLATPLAGLMVEALSDIEACDPDDHEKRMNLMAVLLSMQTGMVMAVMNHPCAQALRHA